MAFLHQFGEKLQEECDDKQANVHAVDIGIGGYDDLVAFFKTGTDDFKLLESGWVVFKVFAFADLAHHELERLWNDGEFLCFVSAIAILFGH